MVTLATLGWQWCMPLEEESSYVGNLQESTLIHNPTEISYIGMYRSNLVLIYNLPYIRLVSIFLMLAISQSVI